MLRCKIKSDGKKYLVSFQIWRRGRVTLSTSNQGLVLASRFVWQGEVLCTGATNTWTSNFSSWINACCTYFEQIRGAKERKELDDGRREMWSKHEWQSSLPLHPGLSLSLLNQKNHCLFDQCLALLARFAHCFESLVDFPPDFGEEIFNLSVS